MSGELTNFKTASRQHREDQAAQEDLVIEWQSKLHDKEQEMKMLADRYEKKLKSMQAELEERDASLTQSRDTIS